MLSLVTVLQFTENLTDRQAAARAVLAIDWKYAIGAELTDTGSAPILLSRFRTRQCARPGRSFRFPTTALPRS
ncbi:transposase [Streptomyces sp. RGM 3693]|uniref:transposase n=1 Tax=Streptomyces sp. RGM 3693 TaxID=3413284 RepID=UPI003D27A5D6